MENETEQVINENKMQNKLNTICPYCEKDCRIRIAYFTHVRRIHKDQWYKDNPNDIIQRKPPGPKKKNTEIEKRQIIDENKNLKLDVRCEYCEEKFEKQLDYLHHITKFHKEEYYADREERKLNKLAKEDQIQDIEEEKTDNENVVFPFVSSPKKHIKISKPLTIEPREAFMSQLLIEQGFARDLSELQKKSLRLAYSMLNVGAAANNYRDVQMDGKKTTSEMLDEIKRRKLEQLEIEQLENEIRHTSNPDQGGKKMDMSEAMILITMMNQNKPQQGETNTFKQAMELVQVINSQQKQPNTFELIQAIQSINQPKNNSNESQLEMLKFMLEAQKGNTSTTEMMSFLKDKSKSDAENMLAIQKSNHERMLDKLQTKVEQLQHQIETTPKSDLDPDVMLQRIDTIKKLGEALKGDGTEKTPPNFLETIEGIGKTITPAIQEMMKVKQLNIQKEMQQSAMIRGVRNPVKKEVYQEVDELSDEEINNMSEEEIVEHYRKNENNPIERDIIIKPKQQYQTQNKMQQMTSNLYNRGTVGDSDVSMIPKSGVELPGTPHDIPKDKGKIVRQ